MTNTAILPSSQAPPDDKLLVSQSIGYSNPLRYLQDFPLGFSDDTRLTKTRKYATFQSLFILL